MCLWRANLLLVLRVLELVLPLLLLNLRPRCPSLIIKGEPDFLPVLLSAMSAGPAAALIADPPEPGTAQVP